jgi:hypothetical protein
MPVSANAQVFGIQETLKELNQFDPTYRRQITRDIQSGAGQLIVTSARSMVPTDYPLTGMARGSMIKGRSETTFQLGNVDRGIKTLVAKRGSKERTVTFTRSLYLDGATIPGAYTQTVDYKARPFALLVAQQKDAAGAIWDHAGVNTRSQFVQNLIARGKGTHPNAPRALAPGVGAVLPEVEHEVSLILDRVSEIMNRNLRIERAI